MCYLSNTIYTSRTHTPSSSLNHYSLVTVMQQEHILDTEHIVLFWSNKFNNSPKTKHFWTMQIEEQYSRDIKVILNALLKAIHTRIIIHNIVCTSGRRGIYTLHIYAILRVILSQYTPKYDIFYSDAF